MAMSSDFMLERFVHHLLQGENAREPRAIIEAALHSGMDAYKVFADILWPTAECAQQLRRAGVLSPRIFNHATRLLATLSAGMFSNVTPAPSPVNREILILSAPREPSDTGAQLLTTLAEARGFRAQFAGARLTPDDLCFAVSRLHVDAIVVHGSLMEALPRVERLFAELRSRSLWPEVQLAITGAALGGESKADGADLAAPTPDELLELLLLCPDHREKMPVAAHAPTAQPNRARDVDLLFTYFPPRSRGL